MVIPGKVTELEKEFFANCASLTGVTIHAPPEAYAKEKGIPFEVL